MKSDEGFSNMSDKTILIDCLNENVIPLFSKKILKAIFLDGLFFWLNAIIIKCQKDIVENHSKTLA